MEHNRCLFILYIYVLYCSSCQRQRAWPAFALPWISTFDEKKWYMPFLAATKQLYEWCSPSVCLSVCLSVRPSFRPSVTPLSLCSHHRIIMKILGQNFDKSDVRAKGQSQRSKVKVTEVKIPFSGFRTVTTVWIHICQWNHAYSLMLLRRGALLFSKVVCQISRSYG